DVVIADGIFFVVIEVELIVTGIEAYAPFMAEDEGVGGSAGVASVAVFDAFALDEVVFFEITDSGVNFVMTLRFSAEVPGVVSGGFFLLNQGIGGQGKSNEREGAKKN